MCDYCDKRKDIKVKPTVLHKDEIPDAAVIMNGGIVLFRRHDGFGHMDINYCPMCGKKLVDYLEYGGYTVRGYFTMEDSYANKEILGKDDCDERN